MRRTVPAALLVAYLLALLDLTLIGFPQPSPGWNLVPLATIAHFWAEGGRGLVVNVVGNLAAFAPLGWLAPWLRPRRTTAARVALAAAALSLAIETGQYFSGRRVADVDDVLLNTLGALAGYLGLVGLRWLARGPSRPGVRRAATS